MHPKYHLVALVPMKSQSERVPGKNFRNLHGKPLFWWILETLLSMVEIELVVINTDAREQLRHHGLTDCDRILVRDRLPVICGDNVSMNSVLADDVQNISAQTYLMTHTTNPLLSALTIRRALDQYLQGLAERCNDSLFTVNRFQTRFYRNDGSPINHDPKQLLRTQDLETWFEENSNLYIFNRESFRTTQARIGVHPILFETPKGESFDIDGPEEWEIVESLVGRHKDQLNSLT